MMPTTARFWISGVISVAIHIGIFSLVAYSGTQAKAQSGSVLENSRISVRHVTAAAPVVRQNIPTPVTKAASETVTTAVSVSKNLRATQQNKLAATSARQQPIKLATSKPVTSRKPLHPREHGQQKATTSVHTVRPALASQSTRVVAAPRPQATSQPVSTARQQLAIDPYYPARYRGTPTQPPYPRLAVRLGQEGTTRLVVEINPQGEVIAISLHKSSGFAVLDKAAIAAVQEWKFIPPTGVTGTSKALVPVRFKLS
jgi:protein TonB